MRTSRYKNDELARKCAVCEQKCANYEIVMQNAKNVEIIADRDKIKLSTI